MGVSIQLPSAPQSTLGGTAGSVPVNMTPATPVSATAAANTAVTATINGIAGQSIRINSLSCGYSGAVGVGLLTIVVNTVTILQCEVNAENTLVLPLPDGGIECQAGQSAVITLAAGGAGAVGFVNASSLYGS
jgi:hypothetical protein